MSVDDRFPDEFGDINHQVGLTLRIIRSANLADAYALDVIEPPVRMAVARMAHRTDDLPAPCWICAAIPLEIYQDGGAVVGRDGGAHFRTERPVRRPTKWMVGTAETASDLPLAPAVRQEEVLLPAAFQSDGPGLGVREANPVQVFKPHDPAP